MSTTRRIPTRDLAGQAPFIAALCLLSLPVLGALPMLGVGALGAQDVGAQRFVGDWSGTLVVGPQQLPIVFHIAADDTGLSATMDSPAQNAFGIPMDGVMVSGDSISLTLAAAGARYDGLLTGEGELDGRWAQGGGSLELTLKRTAGEGGSGRGEAGASPPAVPDPSTRPQTPRPPFPYPSEEVSFVGAGDFELAGTLTLPDGDGPHPGVILVTGSGPQDRDETLLGHKPFAVLADHLTRAGIAVLRYDERGVGASGGDFATATSDDFARDAEAALAWLASRPEVDRDRVGIVGHSEGGLVAPMVASRSELPAFIVMLAGPGMAGDEIILDQTAAGLRADGADEALVESQVAISREIFKIAEREPDIERATAEMTEWLRARLGELDPAMRTAAGIPEGQEDAFIARQVGRVNSPWFRYFLSYDPLPALEAVEVPVLAVNGELDVQVTPERNLSAIEAALDRGGNPDATVLELPGLNHLFQTATTGSALEYAQIDETMSPQLLELVADWINERFGTGG